MHRDGSGTFIFVKATPLYSPTQRVMFDRVRDVKGCAAMLAEVLPQEVAEAAGFAEGAGRDE